MFFRFRSYEWVWSLLSNISCKFTYFLFLTCFLFSCFILVMLTWAQPCWNPLFVGGIVTEPIMQLWFWAPAGYGVRFHPTAHKTSPDPSARWGVLLPSTQTLRFNTAGHLEMFFRQNSCHVSSKLSHEEQKPCLKSKSKTPAAAKNARKASGVKIPSWASHKENPFLITATVSLLTTTAHAGQTCGFVSVESVKKVKLTPVRSCNTLSPVCKSDIWRFMTDWCRGVFPQWHVFSRIAASRKRNREFRVSQEWHLKQQLRSQLQMLLEFQYLKCV